MTDDDRARIRAIRERQGCDTPMYTPGWDHVLNALAEAVDMHERHVGKVDAWRATHVKEKFGVLRISSTGGDAHTWALEHFALLVSARTCQRCGAPGEARKFGSSEPFWHATLCEACSAAERAARLDLASISPRPVGIEPRHLMRNTGSAVQPTARTAGPLGECNSRNTAIVVLDGTARRHFPAHSTLGGSQRETGVPDCVPAARTLVRLRTAGNRER